MLLLFDCAALVAGRGLRAQGGLLPAQYLPQRMLSVRGAVRLDGTQPEVLLKLDPCSAPSELSRALARADPAAVHRAIDGSTALGKVAGLLDSTELEFVDDEDLSAFQEAVGAMDFQTGLHDLAEVEPEAVLRALLEGDPQAVVAAIGAGVVARGKATAIGRSDQPGSDELKNDVLAALGADHWQGTLRALVRAEPSAVPRALRRADMDKVLPALARVEPGAAWAESADKDFATALLKDFAADEPEVVARALQVGDPEALLHGIGECVAEKGRAKAAFAKRSQAEKPAEGL